jgi:hypothetical protein
LRDGKKACTPKLKLTINEFTPDELSTPISRILVSHELTPMSGMAVENGEYALHYVFDGKQQVHPVRVDGGRLFVSQKKNQKDK